MTKPTEQLIDEIVRDFTSVDYIVRPKSEVRRRINELIAEAIERTREGCIKTIMGIPCVEAAQVFKNRAIKKIKENSSLRDKHLKEK